MDRTNHHAAAPSRTLVPLLLALVAGSCSGGGGGGGTNPGATDLPGPFDRADGLDALVWTAVTDASGATWLGGDFQVFGDRPAPHLARLSPDGSFDGTLDLGEGFSGSVTAVLPTGDGSGRVWVAGNFTSFRGAPAGRIVRLLPDGALDTTFDAGTGFDGGVSAIVRADDGSGDLWVGGSFRNYDGAAASKLVRLTADGARVLAAAGTGFGLNDAVLALSPVGDGSGDVYVGGDLTTLDGLAVRDVLRVSGTTGARVAGFAVGTGPDSSAFPGTANVQALVLAPDGSGDLLVGGFFDRFDGVATGELARVRPNGSVDTSLTADFAPFGIVYAILPAQDGSEDVFVGGSFTSVNGADSRGLARLQPDGQLSPVHDPSRTPIANVVFALAHAGDGSGDLVVGGSLLTTTEPSYRHLVRLDADGDVDPSSVPCGGLFGPVYDVLPVPDGGVLVTGGMTHLNGAPVRQLLHLGPAGDLVREYELFIGAPLRLARDVLDDEHFYVVGSFQRYGTFEVNSAVRVRFDDGSPDTSFWIPYFPGFGPNNPIDDAIPAVDGGLWVNGSYTQWDGFVARNVVKLLPSGADVLNNGFVDGLVRDYEYALDGSDRIWVVGTFQVWASQLSPAPRVALMRTVLDNFLEPDPDFDAGTGFAFGDVLVVEPEPGTGSAFVGGSFREYDGASVGGIVLLRPDGSIDPSFDTGTGFDGEVHALAAAPDGSGDLYVAGTFTTYRGAPVSGFVRLDRDGSLDPGFANTAGFNGVVRRIAPAATGGGELYVCGSFTTYDGHHTGPVVRIAPDGSLD